MLDKLSENGIQNVKLTLHVGAGTFQPVRENYVYDHKMHSEYMSIDEDVVNKIIETNTPPIEKYENILKRNKPWI